MIKRLELDACRKFHSFRKHGVATSVHGNDRKLQVLQQRFSTVNDERECLNVKICALVLPSLVSLPSFHQANLAGLAILNLPIRVGGLSLHLA